MNAEEFDTTLEADRGTTEPALIVDVDGFEGPLDLLLDAGPQPEGRYRQDFDPQAGRPVSGIHRVGQELHLELAADYLVMAAWLAYLKSRLILPQEKGPDGETHRRRDGDPRCAGGCSGWTPCAPPRPG